MTIHKVSGIVEGHVDDNTSAANKVQPSSSTPQSQQWENGELDMNKSTATTLRDVLGLKDFTDLKVWRASVAEVFGTAVLVFALDTLVISSYETETKTPNLVMSCLVAIVLAIILLATNPISGGHVNPVITMAAALVGLISLSRAAIYILAQCLGGVLGALALRAVIDTKIEAAYSLGGCTLTVVAPGPHGPTVVGLGTDQALWLEIICTFVFLFASIWMAFDERQAKALGRVIIFSVIGIVVGLLVFVSTSVTATKGYAGAGMNPARCFGPALIRGGHLWNGHWVFWAGPSIACVAFYLYVKIVPLKHFHAQGFNYDFFHVLGVIFTSSTGASRK